MQTSLMHRPKREMPSLARQSSYGQEGMQNRGGGQTVHEYNNFAIYIPLCLATNDGANGYGKRKSGCTLIDCVMDIMR